MLRTQAISERVSLAESLLAQVTTRESEATLLASLPSGLRLAGFHPPPAIGERIALPDGVIAEILAAEGDTARALPFAATTARPGDRLRRLAAPRLAVSDAWLGRVLDPLDVPLDGGHPPPRTPAPHDPRARPFEAPRPSRRPR